MQLLKTTRVAASAGRASAGRRLAVRVNASKQLKDRVTVKGAGPASGTSSDGDDIGTVGLAAVGLGLPANAIMLWSEYTLFSTGAGLPPGPGGLLGAAEGLSYLAVLAIIGWSIKTKASTGSGLPAGPAGLLGAVEGISYLSLLGGIVVFGAQIAKTGGVPGIFG